MTTIQFIICIALGGVLAVLFLAGLDYSLKKMQERYAKEADEYFDKLKEKEHGER